MDSDWLKYGDRQAEGSLQTFQVAKLLGASFQIAPEDILGEFPQGYRRLFIYILLNFDAPGVRPCWLSFVMARFILGLLQLYG